MLTIKELAKFSQCEWYPLVVKGLELVGQAGANLYQRAKILTDLRGHKKFERDCSINEVQDICDSLVADIHEPLNARTLMEMYSFEPRFEPRWSAGNIREIYGDLIKHGEKKQKLADEAEKRRRAEQREKERKEAKAAAAEKAKQDRLERERLQREAEEADKLRKENEKLKGIIQAAPLVDIKKAESLHEENKKVIQQAIKKAVVKIETEKEVEIKEVQREAAAKIERAEKKAQVAKTLEQQLADMTADRDYWKARAEKAEAKLAKISPTTNGRHHNTRRMNGRAGANSRPAAKKKSATHSNR